MQNKYNIKFRVCRPSTEDDTKEEIIERCSNFIKGRKNVRVLAWDEHCALNKNIEVLLNRRNTKRVNYWFCDYCTYWFTTQQKYETHEYAHNPNQRLYAQN